MEKVQVNVISIIHHFVSGMDDSVNGLYEVEVNGTKGTLLRNGDSWGAISHFLGRPATQCVSSMREDRIKAVEVAINSFLESEALKENNND